MTASASTHQAAPAPMEGAGGGRPENAGVPKSPATSTTSRTQASLAARARIVVELLERYEELTDPQRSGNGGGATGLTLMPHAATCRVSEWSPPTCTCFRRSVVELERLLVVMRDNPGTRCLWWHLNERFLTSPTVLREVPVPMLDKHGRVRRRRDGSVVFDLERRVVRLANGANGADEAIVALGVEWLVANWDAGVFLEVPAPERAWAGRAA